MKIEVTELTWAEQPSGYSLEELAERTQLSRADLEMLIDCGAVSLREPHALEVARVAARLRSDFEVDLNGVALALTLLKRIAKLEIELGGLRARRPDA